MTRNKEQIKDTPPIISILVCLAVLLIWVFGIYVRPMRDMLFKKL